MKKLIVLIDMHCDASMPSGAEEFGGGNMYTRNLLKCLLNISCPFIYITRKKFNYLEEKVQLSDNAVFYRISIGDFSYNDKDLLQDYMHPALKKIQNILQLYEASFEFVFHSFYWQSGMLAEYFSKIYKTFFIHSVLSNAERKKIENAQDIASGRISQEHAIFEAAKYIICSSRSERQDMIDLYHLPADKLYVTGRWIHESYRFPVYQSNGLIRTQLITPAFPTHYLKSSLPFKQPDNPAFWNTKSFIYFGRIHENKGVPQIIYVWLELYSIYGADTPALWIIGGSAEQISEFRSRHFGHNDKLQTAEQQGKLVWWGTLTSEGISTLLLKALVVIMHSRYEAGGITVTEAMCQGIPVIATPFGFARDYIQHGDNGYLVHFNDINNLKKYMTYFIRQPFLSNYMGRKARARALAVSEKWNFFSMHLDLYGIPCDFPSTTERLYSLPEYVYKDSIDCFPYIFSPPSEESICYIVERYLGISVLSIKLNQDPELPYIEWEIKTPEQTYYCCYLYPALNWNRIKSAEGPYVINCAERMEHLLSVHKDKIHASYVNYDQGIILLHDKLGEFNEAVNQYCYSGI